MEELSGGMRFATDLNREGFETYLRSIMRSTLGHYSQEDANLILALSTAEALKSFLGEDTIAIAAAVETLSN